MVRTLDKKLEIDEHPPHGFIASLGYSVASAHARLRHRRPESFRIRDLPPSEG